MKNLIVVLVIILSLVYSVEAATYYVSPTATGSGNGSQSSPFTLQQAISISAPGDIFYMSIGEYSFSSDINFSKDGTASNPIRWIGSISSNDYAALSSNGTNSTVLRNVTNSANGPISMGGDYNIFDKIIFQQDYEAKQLLSVGGTGVVLDSCSVKYPSNASSSSNHTIVVTGVNVTFRYSHFYNGSRTIIWVRKNSGTQADNFTMEYCTLTGASNHPPIQIFPATNSTDPTTIKRPIVRNNLFKDNPYGDGIYSRYCEQFAFYNNLFIRSDGPFNIDIHTGFHYPTGLPEDTCNSKGGFAAYNTIIVNGQCNILFNKGSNQTKFENNIFYSTMASPDMVFRFDGDWNANKRHDFDYNLYYSTAESFGGSGTVRGTWGSSNTSVWWSNWTAVTGQEAHSIVNTAPTFANMSGDDYSPSNSTSPQVGKGTPITTANGYWMDVTTDYFGNPRDSNNPTLGAIEYNTGVGDIFPPNLLSAVINNATTVTLNFSEPLNPTTAQNVNNYSVNNGINVTGISLSGSQVVLNTSEHTAGIYLVTVNNVTDLSGNVISPANNTAAYTYVEPDITAPILQGVVLNSSTSLTVSFSEALTQSTAQNINNYSINNGINVTAASVSGSQVILTTSEHVNGTYTLTVSNVTDLAGNIINPTSNTANYEYSVVDLTAPQVVSAAIVDSVELNVYFSENLDPTSAQNINNYNIAGISITNATLSANVVTLSTSIHAPATYSVVVSNVTDLVGNVIDPQHNTAIYEYQADPISGLMRFPISEVLESVVPEPQHNGEKTVDGMGFYQGDPESRWSGDTMPEWLVYDLGDIQILNVTRLSFYKWNEGRTYNYTLQVSTDSINWTTVRDNAISVIEEWSEEVVGPFDARYIKVIFISSNQNTWAGLWESEFWGHLKIPTNLEDEEATPTAFVLEQNYPNPFNPSTMIQVHIPKNTRMRLVVYNMLGEFITELANAEFSSGTYEFNFEARDLSSGIYVYRIESPDFTVSKKMNLVR
jgi:hypothetical protein